MEDVLDVYSREYDKKYPMVCMDEKPYQLLDEVREELPAKPGNTAKQDSEYEREGTCSIFMFTEPLAGWRRTSARERRTKLDWAEEICWLVDQYPDAEKILLVMDNLNTHNFSSLYERYTPQKAFEIMQKLEIHYTPKHGSWLNIAECELSALSIQCLDRRIKNIELLRTELEAWHTSRNADMTGVDWQFTNKEARIKLKRLYPILESDKESAKQPTQLSLF
jgi:hypothetical protein